MLLNFLLLTAKCKQENMHIFAYCSIFGFLYYCTQPQTMSWVYDKIYMINSTNNLFHIFEQRILYIHDFNISIIHICVFRDNTACVNQTLFMHYIDILSTCVQNTHNIFTPIVFIHINWSNPFIFKHIVFI